LFDLTLYFLKKITPTLSIFFSHPINKQYNPNFHKIDVTEIFLPILYKFWKSQNIEITTEKCFQKPKSKINSPETNKTFQQIPANLNRTDNLTLKEIKRYQFSRKKENTMRNGKKKMKNFNCIARFSN
jgi:hypothetical protein